MRQIKFRAWDKEEHDPPKMMPHEDVEFGYVFKNPSENFILMQFTGFLDKNGKEIYEGDILKVKGNWGQPNNRVWWSDKSASWNVGPEWYLGALVERNHIQVNIQVIGNIYENPELVKP